MSNKENFNNWINDGNVIEIEKGVYTTQCYNRCNKLLCYSR